ncbi:hypothetical protein F5Y19DRAFT_491186 [Xylariaceae sp. FL1651]|nr:hypothetical protein F5Y19DRAFT_491186 [Xylariaceae sp. FL1651]
METLQHALRNAADALTRPENHRVIYTTTATTAAVALLAYSRHCYLEWHSLGEGGIPRTPRGWLTNVAAHLIARWDTRAVPAPYEKSSSSSSAGSTTTTTTTATAIKLSASDEEKYGPYSRTSFFFFSSPSSASASASEFKPVGGGGLLPPRRARPTVPTTVIPQRQTTHVPSGATIARQGAFLRALAAANPRVLCIRPSGLESPDFAALWLVAKDHPTTTSSSGVDDVDVDAARVKWFSRLAPGEIAHVHPEGSAHVSLSLVDAAEVVRRGWGERHKLSGVRDLLPWGYVLVYAPRENDEGKEEGEEGKSDWEVWREIVLASARVAARSAGFEGEIVVPE